MEQIIPLSVPSLKGRELEYVTQAIETEWVSTGGAFIDDFENKTAQYTQAKGAVACQNGTSGLHIALKACGVQRGDEVIVPTLTFIAAVNPVKYIGAQPIFMDCTDALTMDADKVREFCTTQCTFSGGKLINNKTKKQIKAVMVVHVFGEMADMEALMRVAKEFDLRVIEDATEALGSHYVRGKYAGKHAGTIGDVGVYSFNGNKIITTGGGGMIVSNDESLLRYAKHMTTQAKVDATYFIHDEIGYNYRMTNLQAAVGLAQMEQLEGFIEIKKSNYQKYLDYGVPLMPFREDVRSNRWFYSHISERRDALIEHLRERRIQARPVWYLLHKLKPYCGNQTYAIEKAEYYWQRIINLPCSTNLHESDIAAVCTAVNDFYQNNE